MNITKHTKDFNRSGNITSSDNPKEAFKKFKTGILNIFKDIDKEEYLNNIYYIGIDDIITRESIKEFCQIYGIGLEWKKRQAFLEEKEYGTHIIDYINKNHAELDFYKLIGKIFSLDFKTSYQDQKKTLIKKVENAIESSNINVSISQNKNGQIILCPKGEEKLYEELVNKTLSFLNENSNKHFEEALKFYQNKIPRDSAERLRRSLEEFLRYKLENKQGLEKNIKALQKKLKNNSNLELRKIIFPVFKYLDEYFNEHSKHNDGNITEPENEFLIYQTGLLMRYINKAVICPQDKNNHQSV